VVTAWRAGTGKREGAQSVAGDSAAVRHRPVAARPRHAWHVARPAEQGRGKGLTGGPQPQYWVVAPADRQARVAQCVWFNSV
jgi:hypothetical protein